MTVAVARSPQAARPHGQSGTLLVLEGIDRSGRSTHARRLEGHLRSLGHGTTRTSLGSSTLAGDEIRDARRARRAGPAEMALLAAADLAEQVDQMILPSLRAGLVVLADRYSWTSMARAEARGVDPDWLTRLFAFVPTPDAVLYLDVPPAVSVERRPAAVDPYEAGADMALSDDLVASYRLFQERLHTCFERFVEPYGFTRVPGVGSVDDIAARLAHIADRVAGAAEPEQR
jgi:dTMP kinase